MLINNKGDGALCPIICIISNKGGIMLDNLKYFHDLSASEKWKLKQQFHTILDEYEFHGMDGSEFCLLHAKAWYEVQFDKFLNDNGFFR